LRTGDLAEFREGRVYITGRCKDILVLSNGENVNPHPLESSISTDPLIEQVCIVGDGRPYLAAILVLDRVLWRQQAHEWGVDPNQPNSTGSHREILKRIKGRLKGLPAFKQVRAVHIDLEVWTIESGLMTPTMKVRRKTVLESYEDAIEQIYRKRR
jgi:long-chain acyl-CoA synthetase